MPGLKNWNQLMRGLRASLVAANEQTAGPRAWEMTWPCYLMMLNDPNRVDGGANEERPEMPGLAQRPVFGLPIWIVPGQQIVWTLKTDVGGDSEKRGIVIRHLDLAQGDRREH